MAENSNSDKAEQESTDDSQKCCSSTSGSHSKGKMVVFAIIVVAAGITLARSLTKQSTAISDENQQLFATIPQEKNNETSNKTKPTLWRPELDSLASLNKLAADTDVVFILLAAEDQQSNQTITNKIEASAKTIESKGSRISAFRLKKNAPNYTQLAKQFSVPCVLAMVKGRGMSGVSGEITEAKLVQAFVTASRATSGCCPSSAGQSDCK